MRPEHLRDMLSCNRRRDVNRLLQAIHALEAKAAEGAPPATWKWMLESRLVFIAKKKGPAPRPVRVGEVWRRVVAKHSLHQHGHRVRQRMLDAHQYGVAIPGGADVLVHTRTVLERCLQDDPSTGVWAVIDLDFENAFPSLEWPAIDKGMDSLMPELAPWTQWCHEGPSDISLPSGSVHRAGRGAEQGDPHGSLQCGVVLADVARTAWPTSCSKVAAAALGASPSGTVTTARPFAGRPTSTCTLGALTRLLLLLGPPEERGRT